jgi:tetratricopeptide (TPR) repeat protein
LRAVNPAERLAEALPPNLAALLPAGLAQANPALLVAPLPRWGVRRLVAPALLGAALGAGLGVGLIGAGNPARALVPYVYLPPAREMEGAGLGIAQAAARLLRMGQAEDAARLAQLTVRLIPNDPRGWILLAEAELRSNHPDQALRALAQAKQLEPGNAGIWLAEGSLALRKNDPAKAVPLLRKGLELDPRNSGAYFDLGNAQIMLNQMAPALTSFERASKLRPDFWEAINNQGLVLFEQGRLEEALLRWRQVLTIKPDAAETTLAMAAGLEAKGGAANHSEAVRLAGKALAEDPNYVLDSFRKEQLWGERLRAATRALLAQPELKASVDRAGANASPPGERTTDGP